MKQTAVMNRTEAPDRNIFTIFFSRLQWGRRLRCCSSTSLEDYSRTPNNCSVVTSGARWLPMEAVDARLWRCAEDGRLIWWTKGGETDTGKRDRERHAGCVWHIQTYRFRTTDKVSGRHWQCEKQDTECEMLSKIKSRSWTVETERARQRHRKTQTGSKTDRKADREVDAGSYADLGV